MDEEKKVVATTEEGSQDLKRGIAEWEALLGPATAWA